jgi:hypothetical protein
MADERDTSTAGQARTASQHHARQKRARTQLSCTPCRTGKLKCDRASPCEPCLKRGRESQCNYPPAPTKSKPANVKWRIRQLESLVLDLMNQQKQAPSASETTASSVDHAGSTGSESGRQGPYTELTPPSDLDAGLQAGDGSQNAESPESGVEKPFGHMNISKDEISYHGVGHWQTILSSISDLKNELGDDEDGNGDQIAEDEAQTTQSGDWQDAFGNSIQSRPSTELGLLVGNPIRVTREDLIKAMPEKRVADRLLSLWFNSPDPFKPIIHAPTYQEEYKQFWKDPKTASPSWLGLTFAILSLAESFGLRDADFGSAAAKACLARVEKLHSLSAAAAVLADFTTPKKYTLECLIFYTTGLRSNDGFMKVWLMIGLILRLSLRMGYHRDPKFYPSISAFDGEMRRRVWTTVIMIDILISFQLGLPSMVRTITTDTEPPRNLLDRDFNPSIKVLPPGRGADELTPASYARTKVGIVRIFAQAAELGHSTIPAKHEEVMKLDSDLEIACTNMPSLLKMPDMSELVTDAPEQLMCRINLALLILKTRIILHRNFMLVAIDQLSEAEQQRGVGTSTRICAESALAVLQLQHSIYAESQPGGKLYTVKWYMGSISTHDFLLAAMVICLVLSKQMSVDDQLRINGSELVCPRRQAMIEALEKSRKAWEQGATAPCMDVGSRLEPRPEGAAIVCSQSKMNKETEQASKAMAVMLDRVRKHFAGRMGGDGSCGTSSPTTQEMQPTELSHDTNLHFQGVASNVGWSDNMDQLRASDTAPNSGYHQSAQHLPPMNETLATTNQTIADMDFSAIGDMIDGPMPMDWDIWDDQIMQQNTQQISTWDQADFGTQPANTDAFDMHQNSSAFVVAGNAIVSNGTAPIAARETSDLQFDWQDMQDVDLDIRDYATGGLWGASPQWQT